MGALHALGGEARRDAIAAWALLHGGFTPNELAAPAPQAAKAKYERAVDHQLSWALTNLKREGLVDNPRWGTWSLAAAPSKPALTPVEGAPTGARIDELRALPYAKYLRSPEWRRTRAAALLHAGHCCSLDVTHTGDLEVHHRTYDRLGAELPADLVVLCGSCHDLHHKANGRPRRPATRTDERSPEPVSAPSTARKSSLLRRLLAR